ncbi:MAG: ribbon-helix-helix domain-containing protein [Caldilineaceae bacterium]|nr:ribbon-helix-helix domain-containing protein [Caldilineaceae bacterium]MDE0463776.1 ribbon-helix-helix domain-containing protein [Caldilineaceae bacterium]
MRTTISLDDRLAKQVRRAAEARGISVSAFIARTLDDALKRRERAEPPPFRLVTVRGVQARPGVDLDRPRALDAQDDEARFGQGSR